MSNATPWANWLMTQLEERGWTQADFVHASQGAIRRDRVSKWLKAGELPSHRLAVATANTLGVPITDALTAAGMGLGDFLPEPKIQKSPSYLARKTARERRQEVAEALQSFTSQELANELARRADAASHYLPPAGTLDN